jgi:glycosyltransferase involved in cell wall biosynthesis
MHDMSTPIAATPSAPQVSVIIPARNEQASLGTCLESLVAQAGVEYEIIVVNDQSTDHTREIAASFPGVQVLDAAPLPAKWTGKNHAVATGARAARGSWLLFTDADTVHLPGSLARALREAEQHNVDLLSYSPQQIAVTLWEMAVLPVVFAELARQYPPSKVSDPNSPEAAANGQYILVKRQAYAAVGGHAAVAASILEDVALARAMKASGRKIRFRYAADAVRTRMYRNFSQLREGWTKNLTLLFPKPGRLAVLIFSWWLLGWTMVSFAVTALVGRHWRTIYLSLPTVLLFFRIRRAKFGNGANLVSLLCGPPLFAYLLLLSRRMYGKGTVSWKGRTYDGTKPPQDVTLESHSIAGRLS